MNAGLVAENYYSQEANLEYFSVSQFKQFEKCEAQAMAIIRGEFQYPTSIAMLIGSYVDAHFEGTLSIFKAQHPEIMNSRTGELKADFQKANEIIQRCESDPFFMEYLRGSKQAVFTEAMFGTKWKAKLDVYLPGERIVDLKCMRSMERIMGKSFVDHWAYDLQLAVYQNLVFIRTGKVLPVYLAVVTKEDYPDLAIINVPQWRLDECMQYVITKLLRYIEVKRGAPAERCEVCDYCRSTKKLTTVMDYDDVGFSAYELKRMKGEY